MKTIKIKGKDYVEVNERIKHFRKNYSGFSLSSRIIEIDADTCIIKAEIRNESGDVVATGHAHEEKSASHINKTSYVENCETSAIGRALAMMGIGIDTSIASANEVVDAIAKQEASPSKTASSAKDPELMSKCISYIKSSTDKHKALDIVMSKHGDSLTDKQVEGIKKFVR